MPIEVKRLGTVDSWNSKLTAKSIAAGLIIILT
jgi:hypothetical protein